jgi:HD-like signal output (HDOD) protein
MEPEDQARQITEKLIRHIDAEAGFIGFPSLITMINRLDDDDASSQRRLTGAILSDVGLVLKLLRNANATARGSQNIATVDQAITVLGLSSVKSAIASLKPVTQASTIPALSAHLQAEFIAAHFCGALAGTVTRHNGGRYSSQEAHVCGLLQNMGRIMALTWLPEEVEQSHILQAEHNLSEDDALIQVLGQSFEDVSVSLTQHWHFPDIVQHCIAHTQSKVPPRATANAEGWFQMCSLFARRVSDAIFRLPEGRERADINSTMNFFHQALQLKHDETQEWIDTALQETDVFLSNLMHPMSVAQARVVLRKSSEKVLDSLSSQDSLNNKGSGGKKPIDLIHQALRMIHEEYGFDFTLLCLPSGSAGLVGVSGVGRNANQVTPKFRCAGPKMDIFQVIMSKKIDLYVADVRAQNYSRLIPDWFPALVGAQSFLCLSLVHEGKFLGLLYGDYTTPHPTPPKEKTEGAVQKWRQQLLTALLAGKPGAH